MVCQKGHNNGLSEYSNFTAIQKSQGGPKWPTISPGDYDFPVMDNTCVKSNAQLSQII